MRVLEYLGIVLRHMLMLNRDAAAFFLLLGCGSLSNQRFRLGLRGHTCLKSVPVYEGLSYD